MDDETTRRSWLLPPVAGVFDVMDLSLLDPADEDDRHVLILSEHPELAQALDSDQEGGTPEGEMNPRMHIAVHEIVANRLWDDNPPEMWQTAQRLTHAGYERHEVLHMLANVVSAEMYDALQGNNSYDIQDTRQALAALPGSWEAQRTAPPNRAARRAQARAQRP
jgi:hypothetical protein